jgi:NADH-quinone oxidoreductase subunit F
MENVNQREVDELLAKHKAGGGGLIELLQEVSARYQYVPREVVEKISTELDVPLTQLYSLATFYQSFKLSPPGKHHVCVCTGTACYVRGAPRLLQTMQQELQVEPGETTPDGKFTFATVNCLGTCAIGPVVTVDGRYYANLTADAATRLLRNIDEIQAAEAEASACCRAREGGSSGVAGSTAGGGDFVEPRPPFASPDELAATVERLRAARDPSRTAVIVSGGTCGFVAGAREVFQALAEEIERLNLGKCVDLKLTGCHGFCAQEVLVVVRRGEREIFYCRVKPQDAAELLDTSVLHDGLLERLLFQMPGGNGVRIADKNKIPFYAHQERRLLLNNNRIDPLSLDDYLSHGGYVALAKALATDPCEVIGWIKQSGLRGRGGGGFPTGRKWELTRQNTQALSDADEGDVSCYVVCNADEGDPGAFMDRSILEGNPHALLEGMAIGAWAISGDTSASCRGYIYVRNEYPLAIEHLQTAIAQARAAGLLGENILNTGFSFDLRIVRGAGAFVCGEETALIESIEDRIGEPRSKPPFPVVKGLWGMPTTLNNVKSWASAAIIVAQGPEYFASVGTEGSRGTAVFSLVGKVANTGLIEVPMGMTLGEIIHGIGGGSQSGKPIKAVQTGGPSGGCIPASMLDIPVDYESLTKAGTIMGSGGMIVMDETTCMVDTAKYFVHVGMEESCGKCTPCRDGLQHMHYILQKITDGRGEPGDIELLERIGRHIRELSFCGLGKTAANPVLSTIRYFRDEYEAHIRRKRCPAVVCRELISSPCQHLCPISAEAPAYIALIAQGRFQEAFESITKDNPLPNVCARVCHHPCESRCLARQSGGALAVRALKRFAVDYAIRSGSYPPPPKQPPAGEPVAIVGSGPAGLMAGYYLAQSGYRATIFEALEAPGGTLAVGIPAYRLPRDLLAADIENIRRAGVEIRTGVRVGRDISFDDLARDFKAVFIATGAHKSRKLGIPHEDAEGVLDSIEFLKRVNLHQSVAVGARVGVIGGGNAAVDAARVALRLKGCQSVQIIYRRTRAEMPAFSEEIDALVEEGAAMQLLAAPVEILVHDGKLTGVRCVRMELGAPDESGRCRPAPVSGSEFDIPLDTLLVAIGEDAEVTFLGGESGIEISRRGTAIVGKETQATGRAGVFAGGDAVTGPDTVIAAMAAGKVAAEMIDKYLRGEALERHYEPVRPSQYVPPVAPASSDAASAERAAIPLLPVTARHDGFAEVELTLTEEQAIREASRCLRCDLQTDDAKRHLVDLSL